MTKLGLEAHTWYTTTTSPPPPPPLIVPAWQFVVQPRAQRANFRKEAVWAWGGGGVLTMTP